MIPWASTPELLMRPFEEAVVQEANRWNIQQGTETSRQLLVVSFQFKHYNGWFVDANLTTAKNRNSTKLFWSAALVIVACM